MPTIDLAGAILELRKWIFFAAIIKICTSIAKTLYEVAKTPLFLVTIWIALTYFPNTIQWIFLKIGGIEIKLFLMVLNIIMPEIFKTASGEMNSWAEIWQTGLNALPQDLLDVMNGIGVAELLGIVTSTITSGFIIRTYRKIMLRAGLL